MVVSDGDLGAPAVTATVQEIVAVQLPGVVENRLAGEENRGAWRLRLFCRHGDTH